jgi:hypothetical protein
VGDAAIKFEVFVEEDSRWVINTVSADETEAVSHARKLLQSKTTAAVQVVRERIGVLGRVFSTIVYEERRSGRDKAEFRANPIEGPVPTPCLDLAAFYAAESRRLIGRVLRDYFDKFALSASEVLYSFRHMKKLGDTDSLLHGAVQQVALAQARMTEGGSGKERAKSLHDLVDLAMVRAQALEADRNRPRIGDGGLRQVIAEASARYQGEELEYRLRYAIAEYLADGRGWIDKLDKLIRISGDGRSAEVARLIDPFVGDLLASTGALRDILGAKDDLADALETLVQIARGNHDGKGTEVPDLTAAICALIATHGMPETTASLIARVSKGLEGSARLTKGEPQDEVAAFRRLIGLLKDDKGKLLGGPTIQDAVSRRSGRWLAPETIDKLVPPPKQPKERYEQLLVLERIIFGDRNKEILAGYMNEIIENPHTRDILFGKSGTVLDKMRILAKLQAKVLESELPDALKALVGGNLDAAVLNLLLEHRVLDKVEQGDSFVHRALKLMQFCRSDALTKGKARDVVRERAQSYLKQPRFLAQYTMNAKTDGEREKLLRDLQALMADAGLL